MLDTLHGNIYLTVPNSLMENLFVFQPHRISLGDGLEIDIFSAADDQ